MTVNTDLIDQVFANITAENLDMGSWGRGIAPDGEPAAPIEACGTTMCFAGHAVVAAGERLKWEKRERFNYQTDRWEQYGWNAEYTTEGVAIELRAKQLLGLNSDQAHAIFHATDIGSDVALLEQHVTNVIVKGWTGTDEMPEEDDHDF